MPSTFIQSVLPESLALVASSIPCLHVRCGCPRFLSYYNPPNTAIPLQLVYLNTNNCHHPTHRIPVFAHPHFGLYSA